MTDKVVEYLTAARLGERDAIMPEQTQFERLCDSIATRLENAGITKAALQATLPEVRERLARRRYPELFLNQETRTS